MSHANPFNKATFVTSAAAIDQLPEDHGKEIAFIGRSNAGKSSAINAITGIKGLAKTSKTPGRTQLMNCFSLDETRRLIDLPGYGFAKVPTAVKAKWSNFINDYLSERACLSGLVLLMDIRHPLKPLDQQMLDWAQTYEVPVLLLLTKADKLKRGALMDTERKVKSVLENLNVDIVSFSVTQTLGVEKARKILQAWIGVEA